MIMDRTVIKSAEDIKGLKIGDTINIWIKARDEYEIAKKLVKKSRN